MEYDELQLLWQQYDTKLNNLEKLNKKLMMETLKKKPNRKLKWLKFQNYYGMIAPPIIIAIALHPEFKKENIDFWFITGAILTLIASSIIFYSYYKGVKILRKIDLQNATILDSASKISSFKKEVIQNRKFVYIVFPLMFLGATFIVGNFNRNSLIFTAVLFVFALSLATYKFPKYKQRIDRIKAEIQELKEYE